MRNLDHDPALRDFIASGFHLRRTYEADGYEFPGYPQPAPPNYDGWLDRAVTLARLSPAAREAELQARREARVSAAREARAAWERANAP